MSASLRQTALDDLDALRRRHPLVFRPAVRGRLAVAATLAVVLGLLGLGLWRLGISFGRLASGMGQLGHFLVLMLPPSPGSWDRALVYLRALAETVSIALLGTLLAAALSLPLGLLAARNTTVHGLVRFATRRVSDSIRGVDQLVWALIWVTVVGLGPFAGVLAVMTSDIGNFSKLFSEAIEAADAKPGEGVVSTGGGPLHRIRFGVLPQVLPVLAGQVLYFFESNTRSSTIIGIVGAGGIGLHLAEQIRTMEWQAVAFILVLILVTVAAIDFVSTKLRLAIVGQSAVAL